MSLIHPSWRYPIIYREAITLSVDWHIPSIPHANQIKSVLNMPEWQWVENYAFKGWFHEVYKRGRQGRPSRCQWVAPCMLAYWWPEVAAMKTRPCLLHPCSSIKYHISSITLATNSQTTENLGFEVFWRPFTLYWYGVFFTIRTDPINVWSDWNIYIWHQPVQWLQNHIVHFKEFFSAKFWLRVIITFNSWWMWQLN